MKFQSIIALAAFVGSAFAIAIEPQALAKRQADIYEELFERTTNPLACVSASRVQVGTQEVVNSYTDYDAQLPNFENIYMTPDVKVYFANSPALVGRAALRTFLDWQWSATSHVHNIEQIIVLENLSIIQNTVTYNLNDGTTAQVKALATWVKAPEDTQTSEVRIYGDFSEVFARFVAIAGPPPS